MYVIIKQFDSLSLSLFFLFVLYRPLSPSPFPLLSIRSFDFLFPFRSADLSFLLRGGSVAQWLARWICNSGSSSLSPGFVLGSPEFEP